MERETLNTSEDNSKKLDNLAQKIDRISQLLTGDGIDAPGLVARIGAMERSIHGNGDRNGIAQKVDIMWRLHVWLLCSLSAGFGFGVREIVKLVWKV